MQVQAADSRVLGMWLEGLVGPGRWVMHTRAYIPAHWARSLAVHGLLRVGRSLPPEMLG